MTSRYQKLAERRYGELLKVLAKATPREAGAKGNAVQGKHAPATVAGASPYAEALRETNVTERSASRYQALADVPHADFSRQPFPGRAAAARAAAMLPKCPHVMPYRTVSSKCTGDVGYIGG